MAKTPTEKALDDLDKAIVKRDSTKLKAAELHTRYAAADGEAKRAERVVKYLANHPDLPEEFDLASYLLEREDAAKAAAGDPDDDEGDTPGVVDPAEELADDEAAQGGGTDEEREPDPEPAPAPRKRKAPVAAAPPAPALDEDDPWGDA